MEVFKFPKLKYYSSTWHQNHHYLVMEWCMCLWFDKTLFVLACTPPPGLTTSHECPQSFPAHWLSHLAVGNGNVWTHMRTVEDTQDKILRILPLLLCLFGYHLAGNGYSAPEQLQRTSCPSLPVLILIVINPLHMSTLVAVVGIPLYRLVIVKVFPKLKNVRMLTKMWIGLYLSLLQVILYIILVVNHDTTYWQQHHSYETDFSPSAKCCMIRTGCDCECISHFYILQCQQYNDPVDNTYLWFVIPQLLNGLSSLLVSMTVFEFICAQAPRTTQGLLIGLWYATFSIRFLVFGILDNLIIERRSWLIYEGVKGFLILVSLVLFSCVSIRYRYRQRDEIVNVQGMIEDTHERWLDQEEEYMQEQREFYQTISTYTIPWPNNDDFGVRYLSNIFQFWKRTLPYLYCNNNYSTRF